MEGKAFLGGAVLSLVGYVLYDAVKDLPTTLRVPASRRPGVPASPRPGRCCCAASER
ncbi:hypothetical protein [Streptomyces sp. NPDC012616]|uniref:hypothetical protein n=1 Tax=Streptomyces sp. NPDC012616 TaxID=3364840 RepID=UPI0036F17455